MTEASFINEEVIYAEKYQDNKIEELLSHYQKEPTIGQVQEWAKKYFATYMTKVRNWATSINKSAYLPEVEIKFGTDHDYWHSVKEQFGDPNTFYQKNAGDLRFNVRAVWDLKKLIFDPEEISAFKANLSAANALHKVISIVTEKYFLRRKLQIEKKMNTDKILQSDILHNLKIQELTADIDALTNANFSQWITKSKKAKDL